MKRDFNLRKVLGITFGTITVISFISIIIVSFIISNTIITGLPESPWVTVSPELLQIRVWLGVSLMISLLITIGVLLSDD